VQSGRAFGVLKMILYTDRYRWEFIPVEPKGFRDEGESACRPTRGAQ
jgi:hypothetical protein